MNTYFKPLDWEINDYIIHINEPSTIDLSPYLNYIIPDKIEEDLPVSHSNTEGGVKKSHVSYLTPKEELPKSKSIDLPKSDIECNGSILFTDDDFDNPKSFVNRFYDIYVSRGVNPELAEILSVQKLLESRKKDGKGFTNLAKEFNNFGGIKAGKDSTDYYSSLTDEYIDGVKKRVIDKFRKFDSVSDYLDYESKYIYGNRGNFNGALSGDVDHYFDVILNRKFKYATAPYYKDYLMKLRDQYFGVKSSKHGGILKAQHGVLLDSYSDPDHYYDYKNGEYDEQSGHWYSRNPATGLELKNPNHPTHKIGQYYDKKEGLNRFRNVYSDRYYTLED